MNIGETCEVVLLDRAGCELFRSDFDLMKEARRFFKDTKGDQGFWERHAESKDFPLEIRTVQLVKNGEVVEDSIPRFKGSPEHELAKRRAILSYVASTRILPDYADELDAADLRADGFLDFDEDDGEWFPTPLGEMEIKTMKRHAILSCVWSKRLLPDYADELDAADLRADGFLDFDEDAGEWFLTPLGKMEIVWPDSLVAAVGGSILSTSEDGGVRP